MNQCKDVNGKLLSDYTDEEILAIDLKETRLGCEWEIIFRRLDEIKSGGAR